MLTVALLLNFVIILPDLPQSSPSTEGIRAMVRRNANAIVQVGLRLRESIRAELAAAAREHRVSFNQELVTRLEDSLEKETVQSLGNAAQSLAQDALRLRSLTDEVLGRLQVPETPQGMPPVIRNTVSAQQRKKEGGDT
jgi:hypothetical protein